MSEPSNAPEPAPAPDPGSPHPLAPHPLTPDPYALRRRVLLTALVTMGAFVAVALTIIATGQSDWLVLPAMVLVWVGVVRPLMRPVREASRLRRSLAYAAFLAGRAERDG